MSRLEPIRDERDFKRDVRSGAAVNTNAREAEAYRKKRRENRRARDLENQIEELRGEFREIREMLTHLSGSYK